ncbi:unnamed protein product [Gongylonema pulchrum]|uniref:Phosphatidylserine decarboxylase n=1 Tax=Gongylonema pulchrum TaxID=637853 RepID=A0A183EYA3_9BILA|nr:unnamed protein product [Gongylonema pulchrum]
MLYHCRVGAGHRFKRQALPTDHIMVHSFNSNISIAEWVVVDRELNFEKSFYLAKFGLAALGWISNRTARLRIFLPHTMADENVKLVLSNGATQVSAFGGRWAHVVCCHLATSCSKAYHCRLKPIKRPQSATAYFLCK